MEEPKDIKSINPTIDSVDLYINVVITDTECLKQISSFLEENPNIKIEPLGGVFYSIYSKSVSSENYVKVYEIMEDLKTKIRDIQLNLQTQKKGSCLPANISEAFAQVIVETNKNFNIDRNRVYMTLRSIFLNLYEHPETGAEVITDEDLDKIVRATTSIEKGEVQENLNLACDGLSQNINKLLLSWIFDQLSIPIINYKTDKKEIPLIQSEDKLLMNNSIHEKISLTSRFKGKIDVLYDSGTNTLRTFNLGKERFGIIFPFMFITQVDQIVFHIRVEVFKIIEESMKRIIREIIHDLDTIDLYDSSTPEELELVKNGMAGSTEFFYRLSTDMVNKARKDNRTLKLKYQKDHLRMLSKQILAGQPSSKIINMTPLVLFDDLDKAVDDLDKISLSFSQLTPQINSHMGQIIDAKRKNNPSLYNKCLKSMRDFLKDVMVDFLDKKTKI
jgi:hypothetical protein